MKNKKNDTFKDTVDQFLEAIGGKDNIKDIFHCATRLRTTLKDESLIDKEKLASIEKAKGNTKEGDQLQIIFGAGVVNKVFDKYVELYQSDSKTNSTAFVDKNPKFRWNHNFSAKSNVFLATRHGIRSFASIFIPLIPLFILGGLALAFNNLITSTSVVNGEFTNGTARIFSFMFDLIGGAILGSLPAFIGFTAAKRWGANPWLGIAIGLILISPNLVNGFSLASDELRYFNLFNPNVVFDSNGNILPGITPESGGATYIPKLWDSNVFALGIPIFDAPLLGYQAQVVPTLLVIAAMVQIEKLMKKISHESIAVISVPLLTGIITTIIAFVIIGPFGRLIGLALARFLELIFIYSNFPGFGLGGAIIGAIYSPIVVTGLHQGFLPVEATLVAQSGVTWITPIATVANIAQGIACLTGVLFFKNPKTRGLAVTGGFSANLGITEPAIFGININVKHIFLAGSIAGAVGGYWIGMTQTVANTFGSASWIGFVQFSFNVNDANIVNWYNTVANSTPWGAQMNLGIPPIANIAIASGLTTVTAFLAAVLLSLTKFGANNLKETNKGYEQSKLVINLQTAFANAENVVYKVLGKNKFLKEKIEHKKIAYIYAPVDGTLLSDDQIDDKVFKENILGKSFVIKPSSENYSVGKVMDGHIANIFETGHAITFSNKNNNSVLVHIGLETAQLNTEAKNLKSLRFIKFNKLIGSKTSKQVVDIADIDGNGMKQNGAKSTDVYVAILNESIKDDQKVELLAKPGLIKKGDVIGKILTI